MRYVSNVRPPCAGYVGGKFRLARRIVGLIPEHVKYVEPFCGAGWILFRKERSRIEVINDINADLINFYRVMRESPRELIRLFEWSLISRDEFKRLKELDPRKLDRLHRAYRFYYIFCLCFGGKYSREDACFALRNDGPRGKYDFRAIPERLMAARERLLNVVIENMDFGTIMFCHNDPDAFFFLDPPYPGTEHYYGRGCFLNSDLNRLQAILAKIRGKWLMTLPDEPYIRQLFGKYNLRPVENTWVISRDKPKKACELFISNYDLPLMEEAHE